MDFPIHIDAISMGLPTQVWDCPLCTLRSYNSDVYLSLNLILANNADPDEMLHFPAFHLGLHCLLKYPFRGLQYTKG